MNEAQTRFNKIDPKLYGSVQTVDIVKVLPKLKFD